METWKFQEELLRSLKKQTEILERIEKALPVSKVNDESWKEYLEKQNKEIHGG
jgi:hypothetical protein